MSVLRSLESKLAGLVEGTFSRAFKSEVRPVEIARKLAKEMDEHKVQSLSRVYAPNEYVVWLSREDRQQFEGYEDDLATELAGYLLEHARAGAGRAGDAARRSSSAPTSGCGSASSGSRRGSCARRPASTSRPARATRGTRWSTRSSSALCRAARASPTPAAARRACASKAAAPSSLGVARRGDRPLARRATSCSTTRTSPAATPRCGRPADRGSSTTSAPPTASRSTGAASSGPQSLKRGDVIELGTSRVTFELE